MEDAVQVALGGDAKSKNLQKHADTSGEELFRALVAEHQEMVINTCYRFVLNREDAEDLAQDVFVEVYRSLDQFRAESKLSTWIYRIAVTKSLDHLRRMKRKKRFSSLKRIIGVDDPAENLPSPSSDNPEHTLTDKESLGILQSALNTLPDNQKTAFLLSKQDGYSNSEIADILQTSVSAVESLIHRAKKNLHEKLYKHYKNN
ncbi:MAG: sigma-70 family RNA polymerase sigma factor [Chlorobium limicola]|jgi:RNA polymerase sigma-70 factor, ECF subfamily|uniref:RNA polymerase sigma factor n=1 Tax=Chlorobium limicola (strain DSM 245 / NBRC 103803 / 6330) TaxID=290315 RepID=B3EFF0_CHLL2|nr:sigma-70 family RNA polymerase sigma factor [Chlorobium limicola]ACD89433.1 RNA polymerase, sigma-24 subunit, ECF subfamily [Chlorobium limicola DSM 245]NTV08916.1 sigma-70 family RNA polymerase sigma factor [Chlorobium limicola]NTV20706.1 sigma-70 family RNA polymerase sigma factor [Chlorobium limicola]